MPGPLHVLAIADTPAQSERAAVALSRADWQVTCTRVSTATELREALERGTFDLVLSAFTLPGWSGLEALKVFRDSDLDLPFIFLAEAVGEEAVAEAMKLGAHDFVRADRLDLSCPTSRLALAVARELREAQVRREKRQMVAARRQMVSRSAFLAQASRRLAQSLAFEETLAEAARVALPEAADWCVIHLSGDGFDPWPVTLRHIDAGKEEAGNARLAAAVADGAAGHSNGTGRRHGNGALRRQGGKALIPSGHYEWMQPEQIFSGTLGDVESARLTNSLGYDAALGVPLWANDRVLGVMTLVWCTPARSFGLDDVGLAEELATRVALALESALLYRKAREAVRARDEFLSIAAHELNTPLATLGLQIEGLVDLSDRGAPGPPELSPPVTEGLVRARRQVRRLGRLVSNLLDVSRLSAYRLDLELADVDLVSTAREVIDQLGPELSRAGCEIKLDAPDSLCGRWDSGRIAQVLTNLLSNACKYGGRRPVEVSMSSPVGGRALISVRDHGIGLEEGESDRILELFSRAHSARPFGGLGLGLYVSRKVVEAHGGVIRARGAPGQGATFEVELPVLPPGQ